MTYYWIHKNDWSGQEIIDEAVVSRNSSFIKVTDPCEAIVYHTETTEAPLQQVPALA